MPKVIRTRTFCSQIFRPLHVIHRLEGLGLLPRKRLFVIVLAGATDAVEKDASRCRVSKEVEEEEDASDQDGRAEGRQQPDDDAIQPRAVVGHCEQNPKCLYSSIALLLYS